MEEYLNKADCVTEGYLTDWYISSVDSTDSPVWTEEHISELCNDFYIIPKDSVVIDSPLRKQGKWDSNKVAFMEKCSECGQCIDLLRDFPANFCPNCGADMGGK